MAVESGSVVARASAASYERWYVRALLALARRDHAHASIAALVPRLEAAEAELRSLGDDVPLARLAARLHLDPVGSDLLAAAVAFAGDPRIPAHAEALGGPLARRGLSIAVFGELAQLDPDVGQHLVAQLALDHPLVRHALLAVADGSTTPAARPYQVPPRLLAYCAGIDAHEPGLDLVAADRALVHDPAQLAVTASSSCSQATRRR